MWSLPKRGWWAASVAACSILVAGCAESSKNIQAQYVSDLQYSGLSCETIQGEMQRVGARVSQISEEQDNAAEGDAVLTGVGIVLFWPALFALAATDDQANELGRLKGEYEALHRAALKKECGINPDQVLAQLDADGTPAAESLAAANATTRDWRLTLQGVSGVAPKACGRGQEHKTRFSKAPYAPATGSFDLPPDGSARYNVSNTGPDSMKVELRVSNRSGVDMMETVQLTKDLGRPQFVGEFKSQSTEGYGVGGGCEMRIVLTPLATEG